MSWFLNAMEGFHFELRPRAAWPAWRLAHLLGLFLELVKLFGPRRKDGE